MSTKVNVFSYCREIECCYLQFVSEVTEDILSKGILTKPALDLLCQTHIDRCKHRLREVSTHVHTCSKRF